jgi:hypothetical protein
MLPGLGFPNTKVTFAWNCCKKAEQQGDTQAMFSLGLKSIRKEEFINHSVILIWKMYGCDSHREMNMDHPLVHSDNFRISCQGLKSGNGSKVWLLLHPLDQYLEECLFFSAVHKCKSSLLEQSRMSSCVHQVDHKIPFCKKEPA